MSQVKFKAIIAKAIGISALFGLAPLIGVTMFSGIEGAKRYVPMWAMATMPYTLFASGLGATAAVFLVRLDQFEETDRRAEALAVGTATDTIALNTLQARQPVQTQLQQPIQQIQPSYQQAYPSQVQSYDQPSYERVEAQVQSVFQEPRSSVSNHSGDQIGYMGSSPGHPLD